MEICDDSRYCRHCGFNINDSVKVVTRLRSLNEKSKEELIKIILRKDKTERANNAKIQKLIQELSNYEKS